jgi:hypothetical protein
MTDPAPDLLGPALVLLAVGFALAVVRLRRDQPPRNPPRTDRPVPAAPRPPDVGVLVGAHVTRWRRRSATAQIAELVRRGVLRLDPDHPARATVAALPDPDGVEHAFLAAVLGTRPAVGARVELHRLDPGIAQGVQRVQAAVNEAVVVRGLRLVLRPRRGRLLLRLVAVALTGVAVHLALQDERTWCVPIGLGVYAVLNPRRHTVRPLSDAGAAVRDELAGVREWLRSGDTAENGRVDLAALHPWAVLFGELDAWRTRGGVEDPALRTLLVELGGDRPERGHDDEQPGDAWSAYATGGSAAEHDGATAAHDYGG